MDGIWEAIHTVVHTSTNNVIRVPRICLVKVYGVNMITALGFYIPIFLNKIYSYYQYINIIDGLSAAIRTAVNRFLPKFVSGNVRFQLIPLRYYSNTIYGSWSHCLHQFKVEISNWLFRFPVPALTHDLNRVIIHYRSTTIKLEYIKYRRNISHIKEMK